jgi:diguanylate cyclase (GGDEF)-like protein
MSSASPISDPALVNSPLFAAMSNLEYNAITAFMERRRIKEGETVFNEGDQGEDMFVLLSGALSAHKTQSDGTQRWMFDIVPGYFFGEMSIIANEPRSATISAKEDSDLMVLQGIDFYRIIFDHPMIGIKMLNSIGNVQNGWLNQTSRHLKDLVLWGETARRRAITDELTGLYNRNFVEESIRERIKLGFVSARKISLIMMDLDKVHAINDKHGVLGGDRVIISVAETIKLTTRPGDIPARLSGDEFAIFLPDTNSKDAVKIAERIRQRVMITPVVVPQAPGSEEMVEINIRTSLGIAEAPTHADNEKGLVSAADKALRKAKERGRNRVEVIK